MLDCFCGCCWADRHPLTPPQVSTLELSLSDLSFCSFASVGNLLCLCRHTLVVLFFRWIFLCRQCWHGFSGFIFSYFVHIDCTFLSFEKKHLGPLNWRTSISLRFYHQGNIVNELSLKFSALPWLFVPNRCSLLGSWNLLSASFENVINWAGSFITGLNFVVALDTPEGLCNDLDIVYTWQSF